MKLSPLRVSTLALLSVSSSIINVNISAVSGAKEDGNRTKFLFLMGTEGSGHHLFNVIFQSSPVKKFLDEVGIDYISIPKLLYCGNGNPANGLFSSIISQEKHVDGSKIFRKLVNSLREVDRTVRSSSIPPPSADWFIPMNSIDYKGSESGMLSYPNYSGETKALQYPDLTVLYAACEEAGVVCKHVVLYRDANEVVNSSMVHRNFYRNFRQGAKTLNSMASVIAMELLKFPDQTAACWNYDNGTTVSAVARMLGWDPDGIVWKEQWSNIYQPTKKQHDELVPRKEKVYFSALLSSFQEIADLCETVMRKAEDDSL